MQSKDENCFSWDDVAVSAPDQVVSFTGQQIDQDLSAPVLLVDGVQGMVIFPKDQVRFNLVQDLLLSPPAQALENSGEPTSQGRAPESIVHRRVCARVHMSLSQFMKIQQWMTEIANELSLRNSGQEKQTLLSRPDTDEPSDARRKQRGD